MFPLSERSESFVGYQGKISMLVACEFYVCLDEKSASGDYARLRIHSTVPQLSKITDNGFVIL